MLVTLFGIAMFVRLLQSLNAQLPMLVTLPGIVYVKYVHYSVITNSIYVVFIIIVK